MDRHLLRGPAAACTANNQSVKFNLTVTSPVPGYELEVEVLAGSIFNLKVAGSTRVPLTAGQTRYRPTVAIDPQYYGKRLFVDAAIFDASGALVGNWEVNFNGFTCTPATPTPTPAATATSTPAPTSTPTPEPTSTPTPQPTSTPTPEPAATPTPEPTATLTPEPTATPTPAPTATPTPEATATPTMEPIATPTIEPTTTPTMESTVTPTVEPTSTPTPAPTATPEPTAEPPGTPQPPGTGTLLVSLRTENGGPIPGGAEVCVTGAIGTSCIPAGAARSGFAAAQTVDPVFVLEIPAGTYLVTVPALGPYAPFREKITISAGQRQEMDIVLRLAQEPPPPTIPSTPGTPLEPSPTDEPGEPPSSSTAEPTAEQPGEPTQESPATRPADRVTPVALEPTDVPGASGPGTSADRDAGMAAASAMAEGSDVARLPTTGQGNSPTDGISPLLTIGLASLLMLLAVWAWRRQDLSRPPDSGDRDA